MDISTLTAAVTSLKTVREAFSYLLSTKIETEAKAKVIEAMNSLGNAQDQLFHLREEIFRLQEENKQLKETISETTDWSEKQNNYDLVKTEGGAVVYKSISGTEHYACPRCMERKEIQILQDDRSYYGEFNCPGCGKTFRKTS